MPRQAGPMIPVRHAIMFAAKLHEMFANEPNIERVERTFTNTT